MQWLSVLPPAAGLALLEGEESEAKKRHRKKKHKKKCKSQAQVCACKCGSISYTCHGKKRTVECGSCARDVCACNCPFTSVQAAIDAASSGDTITVGPGTYTEDITIGKDLKIVGNSIPVGSTVLHGTGDDSVIYVSAGTTVSLESLRIKGGDGGIGNAGTLTLQSCFVSENTSHFLGGGIFNSFTLTMHGCSISGNTADSNGGGIYNGGTLEMTNCSVTSNTSGNRGGGIFNNDGATVKLSNTTVTGNTAEIGGGIYNQCSKSTCTGGSSVSGNAPDDCVTSGDGIICPVGTSSCGGC